MGLFDRLFGKKEEAEKVLPSSEEVTESTEVEETVKEGPTATQNDKEEQKIADMEAYYQELKARIAATHQPVSTVAQEEPAEATLVEEIVTSETPEDQEPAEESPVAVEPAQTEASPEEVSPLADETETEPLEEVKIEAEVTEDGEEADGANGSEMEEESPIASPSSDAELVEGITTEEESPELVEAQDEVSEPEVSEAIAQVEETSEVSEAESRLPQGEAVSVVEERTVEEAEEPIPDEVEPQQETIQEKLKAVNIKEMSTQLDLGPETLKDIIADLLKPGRDLRDSFDAPVLRQDVLDIKDLHIGQKLEGVVRNVIDFGAFVDIGIHEDGLIHISHMSKQFIKHPSQVVSVGDLVTVWVKKIDVEREKVNLSLVAPNESD